MVHIVFHNDIDGIFSAALALSDIANMKDYRLYPVSSYCRGDSFNTMMRKIADSSPKRSDDQIVIVDFDNHDLSTLWIDHHYNSKLGDKPISTDRLQYDPNADSAFDIAVKALNCDDVDASVIKAVKMIDTAHYPDTQFIFKDKSNIMMLRAYLESEFPNDMMFCRMAEVLSANYFNLEASLSILGIGPDSVDKLRNSAYSIKQHIVIYNKISLTDQGRSNQFPRYAEPFIFPNVKYNVRTSPSGKKGHFHIQLSFNKWHQEKNEISIGKFMAQTPYVINGGGHTNVGGGVISVNDKDRFFEALSIATRNEEEMEKYAVDPENDKIEKKAQDMVKTGESPTINAAREKAAQEEMDNGSSDKAGPAQ